MLPVVLVKSLIQCPIGIRVQYVGEILLVVHVVPPVYLFGGAV